ncbi:MAG: tetratricopeptide repeat protein [Balneolales bacterium]
MAKRFSKEQLEADALVTTYARFVGFIQKNIISAILGGVAVLVLIGAGVWYYLQSQAHEAEAQELLVSAEQMFEETDYESALYGDDVDFTAGFAEIIEEYPRTDAANIARYYAAVSALRLEENQEALNYIEDFEPPGGILGVGPISIHGIILENLGEYEEAAIQFKRAADWDRNTTTTPQNLLMAAQAALEAGQDQSAREYLNEIIEEYENSNAADQALHMQGMMSALD